jgi:hypothetical protein
MGLFGKEKLSEVEAAGQFVVSIVKPIQQDWSKVAAELTRMLQLKEPVSTNQCAAFEFALAVIALQIQALPNLLSPAQAGRIREHVMHYISSPDLGSYPREAIDAYQGAWNHCLQQGEPPFDGIASVLFDKLGCQSSVELGKAKFKDPLLIDALSEKIITFGGAWWKNAIQRYKLVI